MAKKPPTAKRKVKPAPEYAPVPGEKTEKIAASQQHLAPRDRTTSDPDQSVKSRFRLT